MKQRITMEDLKQLSPEQKEKLKKLFFGKFWDVVVDEVLADKLDIGQMIEILDEQAKKLNMDFFIKIRHNRNEEEKELCDVLFEMIKAVLQRWITNALNAESC